MPRSPKPFRWRDGWYTDSGGQRTLLLPKTASRRDAETELRRVQNDRDGNNGRAATNLTCSELFALFLDSVQVENDPSTYDQYKRGLTRFAKVHGGQQARQITKLDAQTFKNRFVGTICGRSKKPYMPRTINSALIGLKRCWNWAIESEAFGLVKNPFRTVKLLPEQGRQRIATDDEFRTLMRKTDALFRQVLLCFRYMPIRPQDLRTLQWVGENHVDFENHCWVIGNDKTFKTRKNRHPKVVVMPPFIEKLLLWRQSQDGNSSFVFVNHDGNRWTKNNLCLRMRRLCKRAGIRADANGEEFVLYTNRHTCLTKTALVTTPAELQAFGGHTDYRTTQKYVHLAQQQKVLASASQKAVAVLRPQRPGK